MGNPKHFSITNLKSLALIFFLLWGIANICCIVISLLGLNLLFPFSNDSAVVGISVLAEHLECFDALSVNKEPVRLDPEHLPSMGFQNTSSDGQLSSTIDSLNNDNKVENVISWKKYIALAILSGIAAWVAWKLYDMGYFNNLLHNVQTSVPQIIKTCTDSGEHAKDVLAFLENWPSQITEQCLRMFHLKQYVEATDKYFTAEGIAEIRAAILALILDPTIPEYVKHELIRVEHKIVALYNLGLESTRDVTTE